MILLKNVSKTYHLGETKVQALRNVSLEIKRGESISIQGPSGSGKSTLMHIASGLDLPDEGKVIWENEDITNYSQKKLAKFRNQKVGFVFQQFFLLPKMTVLENVLLPTQYSSNAHSETHQKASEILDIVDLEHRIEHTPNQLSGGELQRVAIGRALINNPQVIFADEPTGNLDSKTGRKIMKILKKLNKEKRITLIAVTHDPIVTEYTDKKLSLKDGEIYA